MSWYIKGKVGANDDVRIPIYVPPKTVEFEKEEQIVGWTKKPEPTAKLEFWTETVGGIKYKPAKLLYIDNWECWLVKAKKRTAKTYKKVDTTIVATNKKPVISIPEPFQGKHGTSFLLNCFFTLSYRKPKLPPKKTKEKAGKRYVEEWRKEEAELRKEKAKWPEPELPPAQPEKKEREEKKWGSWLAYLIAFLLCLAAFLGLKLGLKL